MKYIFVVLIIFMSFHADAKRRRHQEKERDNKPGVTVLNKDGFEYSVKMTNIKCEATPEKLCSMKAAIISKVKATDELKWETPIYIKDLNPNATMESQEVKVYSLRWKGSSIEVRDARDTPYIIESETGEMTKPSRPIVYPAGTSAAVPAPTTASTATPTAAAATPEPAK